MSRSTPLVVSHRPMAADVEPAPAIRQRKPKTYDGLGKRRAMGEFRGRETAKGKQSVGARNRQTDRQTAAMEIE